MNFTPSPAHWITYLTLALVAGPGCSGASAPGGPQATGRGHEGPGGRHQVLALTPEQELSLGEQAYQEILSKADVVRSGPEVSRVREIGQRIAKAAEIEPLRREINLPLRGYRFSWEFNVLRKDQVNAFCLPGGKVAVFTGLLKMVQNDDQLATVMSHEIAHALAHHASERIAREQMYEHALAAANATLGVLAPATRQRLIGLLSAGAGVRGLSYDRQQESEADHIGVFLMTFAGYDPGQAVVFWERMREASRGRHLLEILSDHPSDARRQAQIRRWAVSAEAALRAYKSGRVAPTHGQ
jgi:predicted Zn-dependent protease